MSVVKSFSVGEGDMFYIDHNSDNFTIVDCCYEDEDSRDEDFEEMKLLAGKKGIRRFISTHPDEDHIMGLPELDSVIPILNFYCVENEAIKKDRSENFDKYCELRDSTPKAYYVYQGCQRKWMNVSDEERKSAGINFLWPKKDDADFKDALAKVKEGSGYNNISPIFTYSVNNGACMMWMGDMENDFREKIKDKIAWPKVDVLFAPHHGRESGKVSSDILEKIDPKIIVIGEAPSTYLDYYKGYKTIKQNSARDITFVCKDNYVHIYVENFNYPYSIDTLEKKSKEDVSIGYYIGSFKPHAAR